MDSARANLQTAIGEAEAVRSGADRDSDAAATLSNTIELCAALSVSADAGVVSLNGCEFSVRSAAAAIPARP